MSLVTGIAPHGGLIIGYQDDGVTAMIGGTAQVERRVEKRVGNIRSSASLNGGDCVRDAAPVGGQVFQPLRLGGEGKQGDFIFRLEL